MLKLPFRLFSIAILTFVSFMLIIHKSEGQLLNEFKTQLSDYQDNSLIDTSGQNIKDRIKVPKDYIRASPKASSFAYYLQRLPLKPHQSKVHLYNGIEKSNQDVHAAVLSIDVGKRDLQQCADACMRLRAEYLYKVKKYSDIHFNFTNGFNFEYTKWREGYRVIIEGNKTYWSKKASFDDSYKSFRKYMNMVFSYAGTASLEKELKNRNIVDLEIGDLFIQGGFPGHAMIILDVAKHKTTKEKIFLLGQSYMPAQNIHIVKNPTNENLSPWYNLQEMNSILTPEWTFEKSNLKTW